MGRKSDKEVQAAKELAKFDTNYAGNRSIAQRAFEHVNLKVTMARNARKAKEIEWLEDLRLWSCQNSDAQMYLGRSNVIVPELHKQVETSVEQFMSGLFPNDDYIGVIPVKLTSEEDAEDIKDAVVHELDHKNDLPNLVQRFQRQKCLYGTAFLKPVFEKSMKTVIMKNTKGYAETKEVPKFQGVKVHCMDTFHTYIWPETSQDVDSSEMMFDESFILKSDLEDSGLYQNLKDVSEVTPQYQDYGWVDTIRMAMNNLSTAINQRQNAVLVTEIWTDFEIVSGERVPCVISLANYNTVIRVQRNPFWHQSKPYLMGRYITGPAGEAYGHSMPERIRSLTYMMTDIANQTMDSLTYTLNPIAIIDPGAAGDVNSFKMQPGAKWFASPQGVAFQSFPDISQAGFQGMQQIRSMISQFSDNAPSIAPQLSGKARSATQASAVQSEITANLKNMIRADEFEVMGPLCSMTHWLLKQFQSEEYQVVTQGAEKGSWITKTVNPETLAKDCLFVWRGSEVAQKTAIRTQQIISAFNMAMQTAQMLPNAIDLPAIFKIVMKEGFDLEDLDIYPDDRQKKTVDPKVENLSLDGGEDTPVNPGDDYDEHMKIHKEGYDQADSDDQKIVYLRHMHSHEIAKQAKDMLQKQEAQINSLKQQTQMMQSGGQQPGGSQPQQAGPGNRMQAPSSLQGIASGMRAVEPNQ